MSPASPLASLSSLSLGLSAVTTLSELYLKPQRLPVQGQMEVESNTSTSTKRNLAVTGEKRNVPSDRKQWEAKSQALLVRTIR